MTKLKLKNTRHTKVMTEAEFEKFMADKKVYKHQIFWVEKTFNTRRTRYSKWSWYKSFVIPAKYKLARYPYPGYSEQCLDHKTTTNKSYWEIPNWRASYNPVSKKFYVTNERAKELEKKKW